MLILHSYHRPIEPYARDVALEIAKAPPEGVIIKRSPRIRRFNDLSREYRASWVLDLHSEAKPYNPPMSEVDNPELALIYHGGTDRFSGMPVFRDEHAVDKLLRKFEAENYPKKLYIEPWGYPRIHTHFIKIALFWYRPKDSSVELVKKLAQYLLPHTL